MPRSVQPFDKERLRKLHTDGLTFDEIAAAEGVSRWTVFRRLRRLKVPARPRGRPPIRHLRVTGGAEEIRGLASWLRASAGARSRVELAPSTAVTIAALLEAAVGHEQRSAT